MILSYYQLSGDPNTGKTRLRGILKMNKSLKEGNKILKRGKCTFEQRGKENLCPHYIISTAIHSCTCLYIHVYYVSYLKHMFDNATQPLNDHGQYTTFLNEQLFVGNR